MATRQSYAAVQYLRRSVLLRDGAGLTDGQLLGHFVDHRDEAAFEALVRRHGPMVLGVCRRVLGHAQDAEDAFQAAFLVLARKAASIASRELLAHWLYGVAHRTAQRARATALRQRLRERQVTEMSEPSAVERDDPWAEWLPLLDRELCGLPEKYRVLVVLCDLESRTRAEAAKLLGVPEGTVSSRLSRARALLAQRLSRHGPRLSAGALALMFSAGPASSAMPVALVRSTVQAAVVHSMGAAVVGGVVSAQVTALTEGVLKTMLLSKLKTALATTTGVLLALTVLGLGADALGGRGTAADETAAPGPPPTVKVQWEYKVLSRSDVEKLAPKGSKERLLVGLNELGSQGWELAAVDSNVVVIPSGGIGGGIGGTGGRTGGIGGLQGNTGIGGIGGGIGGIGGSIGGIGGGIGGIGGGIGGIGGGVGGIGGGVTGGIGGGIGGIQGGTGIGGGVGGLTGGSVSSNSTYLFKRPK